MLWPRRRQAPKYDAAVQLRDIVARMGAVVRDIRALRRLLDASDGQMEHTDSGRQHDKEPGD